MSKNDPKKEHESQQGELLLVTDIVLNAENPRQQTEEDAKRMRQSLLVFPKMMYHRKVTLADKLTRRALGGNMRTRALLWIKDARAAVRFLSTMIAAKVSAVHVPCTSMVAPMVRMIM